MTPTPSIVHNRLGAERAFTLDEGIVSGIKGVAAEARVSFPELLAVTVLLALADGGDLPTAAGLAERCGVTVAQVKTYISLLRSTGWLSVSETTDNKKIWMLKRSRDETPAPAQLKVPTLPTHLDELMNAWAVETSRSVSPQQRAAANRELAAGRILGSPRNSPVIARFFHRLRATAGFTELIQELRDGGESMEAAALLWHALEEPAIESFRDAATTCHGLWMNFHDRSTFHSDYYRILSATFRGMIPQVFRSFCKPEYKLKDAIEYALRRRVMTQENIAHVTGVAPSSTTVERFMKSDIEL